MQHCMNEESFVKKALFTNIKRELFPVFLIYFLTPSIVLPRLQLHQWREECQKIAQNNEELG